MSMIKHSTKTEYTIVSVYVICVDVYVYTWKEIQQNVYIGLSFSASCRDSFYFTIYTFLYISNILVQIYIMFIIRIKSIGSTKIIFKYNQKADDPIYGGKKWGCLSTERVKGCGVYWLTSHH